FRRLYNPALRSAALGRLADLCREFGTELIDASKWVGDEGFSDSHHLLPPGARAFTERFWREKLRPRLEKADNEKARPPGGAGPSGGRPPLPAVPPAATPPPRPRRPGQGSPAASPCRGRRCLPLS